jgi:hypothetical protein
VGGKKLRRAQRVLSRREKGSARRLKAKRNVSLRPVIETMRALLVRPAIWEIPESVWDAAIQQPLFPLS